MYEKVRRGLSRQRFTYDFIKDLLIYSYVSGDSVKDTAKKYNVSLSYLSKKRNEAREYLGDGYDYIVHGKITPDLIQPRKTEKVKKQVPSKFEPLIDNKVTIDALDIKKVIDNIAKTQSEVGQELLKNIADIKPKMVVLLVM